MSFINRKITTAAITIIGLKIIVATHKRALITVINQTGINKVN